jgi:hypothetical protein
MNSSSRNGCDGDLHARTAHGIAWAGAWLAISVLWNACALVTRESAEPAALTTDAAESTCAEAVHYQRCSGPAASQADCPEGTICAGMPDVGFTYCMPRPPCAADMVSVMKLACAYPCSDAPACNERGLRACAVNTLAEFTDGPDGWCTP